MTERSGGRVEGPAGTTAQGGEPIEHGEHGEALTALRSIWAAGQQSGADLDETRPKPKVCRNMKNIGFGGIANFSFEIAKFVAVIAIILFVISLVMGGLRGRGTRI